MSGIPFGLIGRYGFVGGFNTAASYATYCLLLYAGANYALASLGALSLGIVLSFVTLGRYVFMSRLEGRFLKFLFIWVVLYFVNIGLIRLGLSFGLNSYIAGLMASVPTIGLAFMLQRFYVFNR